VPRQAASRSSGGCPLNAQRFCTACGTPLATGDSFCTSCGEVAPGQPVLAPPEAVMQTEVIPSEGRPNWRRKGLIFALGLIVLVVAVGAGIFLAFGRGHQKVKLTGTSAAATRVATSTLAALRKRGTKGITAVACESRSPFPGYRCSVATRKGAVICDAEGLLMTSEKISSLDCTTLRHFRASQRLTEALIQSAYPTLNTSFLPTIIQGFVHLGDKITCITGRMSEGKRLSNVVVVQLFDQPSTTGPDRAPWSTAIYVTPSGRVSSGTLGTDTSLYGGCGFDTLGRFQRMPMSLSRQRLLDQFGWPASDAIADHLPNSSIETAPPPPLTPQEWASAQFDAIPITYSSMNCNTDHSGGTTCQAQAAVDSTGSPFLVARCLADSTSGCFAIYYGDSTPHFFGVPYQIGGATLVSVVSPPPPPATSPAPPTTSSGSTNGTTSTEGPSATAPSAGSAVTQPTGTGRFTAETCGSILDHSTGLEWFVGPDTDTNWTQAVNWAASLKSCAGGWSLPTVVQLQGLFEKGRSAGVGYYRDGRHFPAQIDAVFSGIGHGSWVWTSKELNGSMAAGVNLYNDLEIPFAKQQTRYPVRAFGVRKATASPGAPQAGRTDTVAVEATIRMHWKLINQQRYDAAFDLFSSQFQSRVSRRGWIADKERDRPTSSTISFPGDVRVRGDRAEVAVAFQTIGKETATTNTGCNAWAGTYHLTRVGGRWLIDSSSLTRTAC
jgi:hypothetical protein